MQGLHRQYLWCARVAVCMPSLTFFPQSPPTIFPAGSDAVGALLAFALAPSAAAPRCLRSAAYQALLLHPALLGALAAAEGVAEEDLEHSEVDAGDSVAMLEQVGDCFSECPVSTGERSLTNAPP